MILVVIPTGASALCVQGDCLDGQGTVVMPDGRRYVGEFQNGVRTGRGLMTFPDGTRYLGDWRDDKPHGQGTLSSAGKFEYAGAFANGVREGHGTLEAADGKKYTGQWRNDVPHGQGRITYPDGSEFIGQFAKGRRKGQGEATYPDGSKYTGEWDNDKYNGSGTLVFAEGGKYTGAFKNGLMHGNGTYINPDGSTYAGLWQNDVLMKKELYLEPEAAAVEDSSRHVPAVVDVKPSIPAHPAPEIANTLAGYASVRQNGVYVRSGPSTEYRILRSVNRGFPVQIIEQSENWAKIRDAVGQEGWIYRPLLGRNNTVTATAPKINLRSGPGLNFLVIRQVDFGTVLQVHNVKNDWYLVAAADGMEGWLRRDLVWPAGHAAGAVPVAAEAGMASAQPVAADAPVIEERAVKSAASLAPRAPGPEIGIAVETEEAPIELEGGVVIASATDVVVETSPAENIAASGNIYSAPALDSQYAGVVQNGKGANIRSEPSLASEVLRSVPPGYPLLVHVRQDEWSLVEDFRERQGWIYSVLLTGLNTRVIKVGKGNLRSGPGLTEGIIAKLDYGHVIFVDETWGDWLQVSNPAGLSGWLHRDVVWP